MGPEPLRAARPLAVVLVLFGASPLTPSGGLDGVLGRHVRDGLVDYRGLAGDRDFASLIVSLAAADPAALPSREERLAFWINAYNAFVLQGVVERYPIDSVSEVGLAGRWTFFKGLEFTVGGKRLTLDGIEHGILRPAFQDPRVHFALVCASLGCPKLRAEAFHADRLEAELEDAARRFINDPGRVRLDRDAGVLYLSRIFDWYREDFLKASPSIPAYLGRYLEGGAPPEGVTVRYLAYSWRLNDSRPESGGGAAPPRASSPGPFVAPHSGG